jgi:ADP-ribose pyrophosphatase YjhB (NUDIX family)
MAVRKKEKTIAREKTRLPKKKDSAGTLLYRRNKNRLEVLLVHPSGNYNRKAAWSIPKGQTETMESFEDTARRETFEETGVIPASLKPLGYIDYTKQPKRLHCFYGPAPVDALPHCASWEIDQAEFMTLKQALKVIHKDQSELLKRLQFVLNP